MSIPRFLALAALLLLALSAGIAPAADNAFLIQGPVQVDDSIQMANSCVANRGMSQDRFRLISSELKREYLKGTTPEAARKVSFRFAASCPGNYRATCHGIFGEKASQHYMADDYMVRSGMGKLLCESSDGVWK